MTEDKKKDEIEVIEIKEEFMKQKLYEFRGCKVLLDADLAEVYGYELKAFNQQVKRNIERFQNDMMFQLSDNEVEYLRSQIVTANISSKSRSNPYVFTEQGVYMLMTVLKALSSYPYTSARSASYNTLHPRNSYNFCFINSSLISITSISSFFLSSVIEFLQQVLILFYSVIMLEIINFTT